MAKLGALAVLVCLVALFAAVWVSLDSPIELVDVQGQLNEAEKAQITAVVVEQLGVGLLAVDLEQLRSALLALSWPRRVSVRRVWPDRLVIGVDKAMVVAAWNDAYLTSDGKVVELARPRPELVAFDCAAAEPALAMDLHQRLSATLASTDLQIRRLQESSLGEWSVTFANSLRVELGASELTARLMRFVSVYESALNGRVEEIVSVDARYANGIAVGWRQADFAARDAIAATDAGGRASAGL